MLFKNSKCVLFDGGIMCMTKAIYCNMMILIRKSVFSRTYPAVYLKNETYSMDSQRNKLRLLLHT